LDVGSTARISMRAEGKATSATVLEGMCTLTIWKEGKRGRGEEGKRGRGEEGKRGGRGAMIVL
jgi:hypothetical protein